MTQPHLLEIFGAVFAGLASHWTFFIHGEHDLVAANIARVHFLLAISIPFVKSHFQHSSLKNSFDESFYLYAAYLFTLFTSIIVFRLLFSPLRHIPGPLRLQVSKLTHVWDMANGQNCKLLHDLHKKYGDVVRTGMSPGALICHRNNKSTNNSYFRTTQAPAR